MFIKIGILFIKGGSRMLVGKIQCVTLYILPCFEEKTTVERKVFTMDVSGTANGVSFSETDDWEQDEVIIRLKHSCRPLGGWN